MLTSNSKDKERSLSFLCCWYLGRRRVAMLLLLSLAFVVFVLGSYTINKESSNSPNIHQSIETIEFGINQTPLSRELSSFYTGDSNNDQTTRGSDVDIIHPPPSLPSHHPCDSFSFPPPPPPGLRRPGPRPCPVCYLSPEEALAHMPKHQFESPVLKNLTFIHEESPVKHEEGQGGSEFGGYPSLEDRTNSFDIKEEHIPITNLFTCVWFNEVDRFTSRDQLSFAVARDKIREKVDWSINMFLDCERRNFVKQVYHRDVLMNMKPPRASSSKVLPEPLPLPRGKSVGGRANTGKKSPGQRGKRRHRKVSAGGRNMR
ncbi:hypothetical protein BRARA_H00152 [Brassica rapa]|uniref:TOD1/MUCI70 glycosyltransferase-like domain-containing protein n=1 Tax=Brassica campestris TaxID=3711 RepID=A0A397YF87_BRACM|nr:hypothetical protein BRARA_H00152 [Brassica rapa]